MIRAEYIDHMGSDLTVVNAARVSFDKESALLPSSAVNSDDWDNPAAYIKTADARLISYLARRNHWTPFAHCQLIMRETVPIFVARQRFKHTVGFAYNEVSRRYVDDEPEFYVPEVWRGRAEDKKQGSGGPLSTELQEACHAELEYLHEAALAVYHGLLAARVAPEQARMVLPQSMMTSYYVTGSLAAWARFYKLRSDEHAQAEIRELAEKCAAILEKRFPVSWQALVS